MTSILLAAIRIQTIAMSGVCGLIRRKIPVLRPFSPALSCCKCMLDLFYFTIFFFIYGSNLGLVVGIPDL